MPAESIQVADHELYWTVSGIVQSGYPAASRLIRLGRRVSPYQSSFTLEELDAVLDDGTWLRLMFKSFGPESMSIEARDFKPSSTYNPRREILVYRDILARCRIGTPAFHAASIDDRQRRYWLFIERVEGQELYQIGDFDTWRETAGWLGKMHRSFTREAASLVETVPLLRYGAAFFEHSIHRAEEHLRGAGLTPSETALLCAQYRNAAERILALPVTLLHGDFYPSNVLIAGRPGSLRVCPVDWELSGIGAGLMDLAALVSGCWTDEQRRSLTMSYIANGPAIVSDPQQVIRDLNYCRLHVALQWSAVFSRRQACPQHRQDWLAEALRLAKELR